MNLQIRIDYETVRAGLAKAPDVLHRHIEGGLSQGAQAIAAEAKARAPKSLSNLWNSILAAPAGPLRYEVRAGVMHAAYVEHGTGPAVGKPKYYPNPDNLLQYLMTSPRARGFKRFKRSDRGRLEQEMGLVRRAQAFAWWIYQHGTKPQPFMAPAAEAKRDACTAFVRAAVDAGLKEIFR